ncbi:MAG: TonB-dependent siderophore receptor [Porticoccaceae bacterium]
MSSSHTKNHNRSQQRAPRKQIFRPLALAVGLGLSALVPTASVHADSVQQASRNFQIQAGSLDAALAQFGQQSGVLVSVSGGLSENKHTAGLKGDYAVEQGLDVLLRGTGLQAVRQANDSFIVIRSSPQAGGATTLPTVRVEGVTEGTGSYTTGLTNTATRLDLSLRETPQSVTVVTRQRIEDQGLNEIKDVLQQATGVYVSQGGALGSDLNTVYSRGFMLENYQVDGVPQGTRFGYRGDVADTVLFDRVEVLRGASGLLSGVGEPSGAVNMVRKLPTADFQAHATARYGSWDHHRVEGDISGPLTAGGRVRGRVVSAWQDSEDFIDRLGLEKKVLYGVVETDVGSSTLVTAGIEYQDIETVGGDRAGMPFFLLDGSPIGLPRSANAGADWASALRRNLTYIASVEHFFDNGWRLELDLERAERRYDNIMAGALLLNWLGGMDYSAGRWAGDGTLDSARFHAIGPYQLLGREHELVLGVSHSHSDDDGGNYNDDYYSDDPLTVEQFYDFVRTGGSGFGRLDVSAAGGGSRNYDWQSGAYLATRLKPADAVTVLLGARLSNWKTRRDRYDTEGAVTRGPSTEVKDEVTPYAGIVVDVTDYLSVYASYTDIFKPASQRDANGDLLDPAVGSNLEGGVKLAFFDDRLNISGAYYRTKKDNVPEYVPGPGGSVNYGPTGDYVYEGIDGTKTTGFELEIAGQLTPRWEVGGGYSHTDPRDANGERRLAYVPSDTFKLFSAYRLTGVLEGVTVGGNLLWQDSLENDCVASSCSHLGQGGVTTVDLMAAYRITSNLSATLNVNNLFDKSYFNSLGGNGVWYGTPRSAFLSLRYSY